MGKYRLELGLGDKNIKVSDKAPKRYGLSFDAI